MGVRCEIIFLTPYQKVKVEVWCDLYRVNMVPKQQAVSQLAIEVKP